MNRLITPNTLVVRSPGIERLREPRCRLGVGRLETYTLPTRASTERRRVWTPMLVQRPAVIALAYILIAAFAVVAAPREYKVAGDQVAVYNVVGAATVIGGSGDAIVVRVDKHGDDAERLAVDVGTIRDTETLRIRYPASRIIYSDIGHQSEIQMMVSRDGTFGDRGDRTREMVSIRGSRVGLASWADALEAWADLTISVPSGRRLLLYVGASATAVTIRNVDGDIELALGVGDVTLDEVTGHRVVVNTTSGSVQGSRVDAGSVTLSSGFGDVTLESATSSSSILVATQSGSVRVTGSDAEDRLEVDTGFGDVTLDGVTGQRVVVDTTSGNVQGSRVDAGSVTLSSGFGDVTLATLASSSVVVSTQSGSVNIGLVTDIKLMEVDTGFGDVVLRIPDEFGSEFEVNTGFGRVSVDVPFVARTKQNTYLSGRIGDGNGKVKVDTRSGSVFVLQR